MSEEIERTAETLFDEIHEHRLAIAMVEIPYTEQLQVIDDEIESMISDLMTRRTSIQMEKDEALDQHTEAIAVLTEDIKEMVLTNGKTCSTVFGTCTHVKGRKASIKWDDAALMGYVSASPDNEAILQFRSEGKEGAPSTRFKLVELED